jgi:hypothetical protein
MASLLLLLLLMLLVLMRRSVMYASRSSDELRARHSIAGGTGEKACV